MNNFIRGGQVTLHRIRMLWQVVKVIVNVSILLAVISFGYCIWSGTETKDWGIYVKSLNSNVTKHFDKYKLVEFTNPRGRKQRVVARFFDNNYFVRKSLDRVNNAIFKGVIWATLSVGCIVSIAMLFFWWRGGVIKSHKNIRGAFLLTKRRLRNLITKHNKKFREYNPFKIVDIPYAGQGSKYSYSSGEQSHTLIVGATGSGKTKIIKDLLTQLVERNQKAIIVDVKGDYIKNFYWEEGGCTILNPMDARGANWGIWKETDVLRGFHTIARCLIPKTIKGDPIWNEAAALVVAELAKMYWDEQELDKSKDNQKLNKSNKKSKGLSLSEFVDKVLTTDIKTLEKLLKKTAADKLINENLEKAALSILMVICNYLMPLKLYKSNKNCFSITDWVKDDSKGGLLFISSLVEAKEQLNPIVATQVSIAVNAIRSLREESKDPKIWFILDEISYFSDPITSLQDGLTTARSFGGCFVLGTQDMSSLEKVYGENSVKTFANNCRTKLFLSVDNEAAKWCSEALGEGEVEEWHEGLSYGAHQMRDGVNVNRARVTRKAVLPSEIANLGVGQGYIKVSGFNPSQFKAGRFSWFNNVASPFVENHKLIEVLQQEITERQKFRQELEDKLEQVKSGKKIDRDFALKKEDDKANNKAKSKTKAKKKIKIKLKLNKTKELKVEDLVALWESYIPQSQKWGKFPEKDYKLLEELFKREFNSDGESWEKFCIYITHSKFLMGKTKKEFKTYLGWVVKDENARKILDGKYHSDLSFSKFVAEVIETEIEEKITSEIAEKTPEQEIVVEPQEVIQIKQSDKSNMMHGFDI